MDLNRFIESFPQLQEFLYVGIFDHDFHRTFVTWSNYTPINKIPNFPADIEKVKNTHISHIVLLPYNPQQKPIFIPTDGHIVLDHQKKNILIVGIFLQ